MINNRPTHNASIVIDLPEGSDRYAICADDPDVAARRAAGTVPP
jgi:hypothetical protein